MDNGQLYEFFHRGTKPQRRVMKKDNFTYRSLLGLLTEYSHEREKFLDIGCGSGAISLFLASQGKEVLGIDISTGSINACKEGAKRLGLDHKASFSVMDFSKEKPNRRFGVIICSEVLEHIKDDKKALAKIHCLLNPGGLLLISVPSRNAPLYRAGLADKFDARVGHLRRYDCKQLVGLCKDVGFKILESRKTEGVLRNFLFLNPIASKAVRFIRGPISDFFTVLDNITLKLFGESQIFVVAQKK